MADGLFSGGAAFGVFPQMQPRRRLQDPEAAANVPLSVLRGYAAGTAGLPGDIEGLFRSGLSQVPTEFFTAFPALRAFGIGSSANPTPQFPTTEFYNQYLPGAELNQTPLGKAFTSAGNLLGGVGSTNIAGLGVKGAKATGQALGPTAGRMAEGYLQRQGLMPNIVPEAPKNLFGGPIEKPQAPVSELGFYSAAEQAALNIPRKSGTGQSFMNDLMKAPDVKKDELSWMGLDDFLKDKPNVTKQEVQDFISANRVDVQERQLGGKSADQQKIDLQDKRDNLAKSLFTGDETVINGKRVFDDELGYMLVDGNININQLPQAKQAVAQEWVDTYTKLQNFQPEQTFKTRYERYQLPGGENYREILLTTPVQGKSELDVAQIAAGDLRRQTSNLMEQWKSASELNPGDPSVVALYQKVAESRKLRDQAEATAQKLKDQISSQTYRSSHFDEPNILAHMRVNDRVDADGKKMLLIEEIQSDWHQAGREKGYGPKMEKSVEAYYETKDGARIPLGFGKTKEEAEAAIDVGWKNLVDIKYETLERKIGEGVPDAPFKDTWHQLALKRALKYAADNGYDRVGLTTGRQQADRYQLSKQISEVHYSGTNFKAYDLDGNEAISRTGVKPEDLAGLIGKEPAKKLLEQPKQGTLQSLTGQNLDVGGEGMKKYYDEIYPAFLAKQGKKYNAKTGETRIKTGKNLQDEDFVGAEQRILEALGDYGERGYKTTDNRFFDTYADAVSHEKKISSKDPFDAPIRYIDISPEMRGGVKKGQPLFTAAPIGGIGLGAGMQDNEMPEAVRQYMADPRYSDPFADPIR